MCEFIYLCIYVHFNELFPHFIPAFVEMNIVNVLLDILMNKDRQVKSLNYYHTCSQECSPFSMYHCKKHVTFLS